MNNHKKDRRDDERKPKRRGAEGSADRKPYGRRDTERGERTERKPYESRNSEGRTERRPYGTRGAETNERTERKPYVSKEAGRGGDRRDRNEGSFERPERKYNSDKPKRKSSTSRTPASKPGPFDKFDVKKMREAKAESLEKKERRRPSRRGIEERTDKKPYGNRGVDERAERRPYERRGTEGRADRKPYERRGIESSRGTGSRENRPERKEFGERNTERGARSRERIVRKERSFDKPEGGKRFERPAREDRSEKKYSKKESSGFERKKTNPDDEIRLNRYIANSGICSRRKADELIEKGEVTVNGEVIRELGYKVKYSDKVKFEGKLLKPGKLVYVLLNKPKDYITTMDDPMERRTVVDLTTKVTNERIFPVGRLDRNTTGLLLLTNDGDLADKLSHPRNQVKKVYEVELDKSLIAKDFEKVRDGVELEDGPAKVDMISYLDGKSKKFVGVEIHIGRNRIVRRIFESLGYEVVRLDRVIYAGLTKKDLPRGRSRLLTKEEIIYLKHLNKY